MDAALEILEEQFKALRDEVIHFVGASQNILEFTNYITMDIVFVEKDDKIKFKKLNKRLNKFYKKVVKLQETIF